MSQPESPNSLITPDTYLPQLYGHYKIHKPNGQSNRFFNLRYSQISAKHLKTIHREATISCVEFSFCQPYITLESSKILVSLDVFSLFTRVPISNSVATIQDPLAENDEFSDLLPLVEICLTSTHILCCEENSTNFQHSHGLVLFSLGVADIFKEALEGVVTVCRHTCNTYLYPTTMTASPSWGACRARRWGKAF